MTLALGWTNGWSPDGDTMYTWAMVHAMQQLLEKHEVTMPVTFNVRAKLARHSLQQLRWLMEMSGASLTLFSPPDDDVQSNDLLNLRHNLPIHKVFYDVHKSIKLGLETVPQDVADGVNHFEARNWDAQARVQSPNAHIYIGREATVFRNGLLFSSQQYEVTKVQDRQITGKIEFFNMPTASSPNHTTTTDETGFEIYLRTYPTATPERMPGIRCSITLLGSLQIIVTPERMAENQREESLVEGTVPCFVFRITDHYNMKIRFEVSRLKNCHSNPPEEEFKSTLELNLTDSLPYSQYYHMYFVATRATDTQAFVVLENFQINTLVAKPETEQL